MKAFADRFRTFIRSEDGPTATEYAVMLALIIVAAITTIGLLGTKVNDMFSAVDGKLVVPS